jgi:phosphate/sulfate permease
LWSLSDLSDGISEALFEACPVLVHVALSLGLRVHFNAILAGGVLGIGEEGNLQTTGGALVRKELEAELSRVLLLNTMRDLVGVLSVASAATVVYKDVVGRSLASLELSCW